MGEFDCKEGLSRGNKNFEKTIKLHADNDNWGLQKRCLWRRTPTVLGRGWRFEGDDRIRNHQAQSSSRGGICSPGKI